MRSKSCQLCPPTFLIQLGCSRQPPEPLGAVQPFSSFRGIKKKFIHIHVHHI